MTATTPFVPTVAAPLVLLPLVPPVVLLLSPPLPSDALGVADAALPVAALVEKPDEDDIGIEPDGIGIEPDGIGIELEPNAGEGILEVALEVSFIAVLEAPLAARTVPATIERMTNT